MEDSEECEDAEEAVGCCGGKGGRKAAPGGGKGKGMGSEKAGGGTMEAALEMGARGGLMSRGPSSPTSRCNNNQQSSITTLTPTRG